MHAGKRRLHHAAWKCAGMYRKRCDKFFLRCETCLVALFALFRRHGFDAQDLVLRRPLAVHGDLRTVVEDDEDCKPCITTTGMYRGRLSAFTEWHYTGGGAGIAAYLRCVRPCSRSSRWGCMKWRRIAAGPGYLVILVAKAAQLSGVNREERLPGQNSFDPMMSSRRAGRASRNGSAKRREKKDSWRVYATLVSSALRTHRTHMTLKRGARGRASALPPPPRKV